MNIETREDFFQKNWAKSKAGNLWCRVGKTTYTIIEDSFDYDIELPNGDFACNYRVVVVSPKGEKKEFLLEACDDVVDPQMRLWPYGREKPLTVEDL